MKTNRREFLKTTGRLAAVSALAGTTLPHVHASGSDLVQLALVGCGGRGSGAAVNALNTKSGPIKLVAMADAYEHRLRNSYESLSKSVEAKMDVLLRLAGEGLHAPELLHCSTKTAVQVAQERFRADERAMIAGLLGECAEMRFQPPRQRMKPEDAAV